MVTDPVLYRTEGNREGWGLGTVVTGEEYAFKDAGVLFSPIAAVQEEHRPMLPDSLVCIQDTLDPDFYVYLIFFNVSKYLKNNNNSKSMVVKNIHIRGLGIPLLDSKGRQTLITKSSFLT